jgi:flagellar L-ring protein FlgH
MKFAYAALAAVGLFVLAAAVTPAGAGSIWARANANPDVPARVYEDDVARRVGDILTILIDERSNIDNETERKNDRSGSGAISGSGSVALNSLGSTKPFTLPNVDVTAQASNTFDGKADLKSQRTQSDRITVTVHDVLPNGNLVILGSRQRNVHGDTQTISISGIVRPSDITYSNTINSEQVADFRLVTLIKGPENDVAQPGLIGWIMNWVRLMTW